MYSFKLKSMSGLTNLPTRIQGLVLAGGKSSRMGTDKGMIDWHGKEQRYHVADLLMPFCEQVFISCRSDQQKGIAGYRTLADQIQNCGPFGGLLSAFKLQPEVAWLCVACDLPMLDLQAIDFLITNRDTNSVATVYQNMDDGLPEPMLVLWEPAAYPLLLASFESGNTSLRQVLLYSPVNLLTPEDPGVLTNVNTPEEVAAIRLKINL